MVLAIRYTNLDAIDIQAGSNGESFQWTLGIVLEFATQQEVVAYGYVGVGGRQDVGSNDEMLEKNIFPWIVRWVVEVRSLPFVKVGECERKTYGGMRQLFAESHQKIEGNRFVNAIVCFHLSTQVAYDNGGGE